jgi:hypothetical protein
MIIQEWKEQIFRVWISWGYDLPFRLLNNASVKSFNLVKSSVYGKVGAVIYLSYGWKMQVWKVSILVFVISWRFLFCTWSLSWLRDISVKYIGSCDYRKKSVFLQDVSWCLKYENLIVQTFWGSSWNYPFMLLVDEDREDITALNSKSRVLFTQACVNAFIVFFTDFKSDFLVFSG